VPAARVHPTTDRSSSGNHHQAGHTLRGGIECNVGITNYDQVTYRKAFKTLAHSRSEFLTANTGQTNFGGEEIRAPQAGRVASFIDGIANRSGRIDDADPERVGRSGNAFAENVQIEVKNDGMRFRSASIQAEDGSARCRVTLILKTRRFRFRAKH
jgi:hypothetical protein